MSAFTTRHPDRALHHVLSCIPLVVAAQVSPADLIRISNATPMRPLPEESIVSGSGRADILQRANFLSGTKAGVVLFEFPWSGKGSGKAYESTLLNTIGPVIRGRVELVLVWDDGAVTGLSIVDGHVSEPVPIIGLTLEDGQTPIPPLAAKPPPVRARSQRSRDTVVINPAPIPPRVSAPACSTPWPFHDPAYALGYPDTVLYGNNIAREQDAPVPDCREEEQTRPSTSAHAHSRAGTRHYAECPVQAPVPADMAKELVVDWDDLVIRPSESTSHGPRFQTTHTPAVDHHSHHSPTYREAVEVPSHHAHSHHHHDSSSTDTGHHSSHSHDASCGSSSCGSSCGGGGGGE